MNESIFQVHLKDPNPWHTHLAHPKKKFLLRKFLRLIKRISFSNETIFHTRLEKLMFKPKKIKYLPEKINFPVKEKFLMITRKNNFPYKKSLILAWKKIKPFISYVFWIGFCYFSWYKQIRLLTKSNSQSLLVKHFYFSIVYNIFFYTRLVFLSSGKFSCRLGQYRCFSFFSSSERSWYLPQDLFEALRFFDDNLADESLDTFIYGKSYIKKTYDWRHAAILIPYCLQFCSFLLINTCST